MSGIDRKGLAVRLALDRDQQLTRFGQAALHLRRRSDPAAAHDVRVALRRLEATLDLWRTSLPRRRRLRAVRAMRRLRRALGPLGEAWMIVNLLHQRASSLPRPDRAIALEIARSAQRQLEKLETRSRALCAKRRVKRLRALYEEVWPVRETRWGPGSSSYEHASDRVDLRRALASEALCNGSALGTDEALHAARVAVKRWRYASERLGAVVPTADASTREWLKSVQQTLGCVCDLRMLRTRIVRWAAKHGPSDAEPASWGGLLRSLEAERLECIVDLRRLLSTQGLTHLPVPAPPPPDARTRSDP